MVESVLFISDYLTFLISVPDGRELPGVFVFGIIIEESIKTSALTVKSSEHEDNLFGNICHPEASYSDIMFILENPHQGFIDLWIAQFEISSET
jgi:hypothetical protein